MCVYIQEEYLFILLKAIRDTCLGLESEIVSLYLRNKLYNICHLVIISCLNIPTS